MADQGKVTAKVSRKKRIRYASIRYHDGKGLASPGRPTLGWKEHEDNPMSVNFVPIEARNEMARARWFALYGRKNSRPQAGQFDPS